jgi:hypothetical protein
MGTFRTSGNGGPIDELVSVIHLRAGDHVDVDDVRAVVESSEWIDFRKLVTFTDGRVRHWPKDTTVRRVELAPGTADVIGRLHATATRADIELAPDGVARIDWYGIRLGRQGEYHLHTDRLVVPAGVTVRDILARAAVERHLTVGQITAGPGGVLSAAVH